MADNITLKIDADVSDAQSAIAKFQKTTEKAFNSSNTKIQQTGNQLNNLTHNLDRVAGKMKQLENTRFKTEEYKKLESNISKVGSEITKTETKVKKLADKKIPTTEYLNLKDRVKDLGTEIKTTESELKKWEKSDVFKATEKDVASLTRKYSEATIYAQKLLKGGVKSYDNQYIEAKNNVKALGKELKQAKAYQQSLIDSGKQYKNQNEYEQKANKLKILKGELVAVQQQMKSMEVTGKASTNTLEYEQLKDRLEDLRREYKQLNEEKALLDRTGAGTYSGTQTTQYQSLQDQYTGLYNRASMVNNKINEMNKGTIQVMSSTQLVRTAVDSVKSAWRTVINIVKVGVKGITTAFKSWATSAKNSIRSVSNMFTSLFNRSVGNSTKYHNNSFKSMITMLLKYAFGIRSIFLLYKKVRSTISTGLTEMGKEFSDVQADINSLKNSWATFKSSLISAFQPIYSYVVPALVTLINYLTSAMNALANFFAIMTGKSTYKKAIQQNEDYASSVSDTGSAAEDANEELAEYDDLIVISQDKSSGSGGSGSGADTGWQWEEVPTTTNATIEAIKSAWENSDWTSLGNIIRDKLISMMNGIPWDTIYQKASNFGKNLASFLNGLFANDEEGNNVFSSLGTTIAGALNTALYALNSFAKEFKWDDFGKNLASGIESFFKTFKWDLAVDTFNTLVNGILTAILEGLTKLINDGFFESLADTIAEAIGGIDTSGFGTKLGKIATAIATALGTLVSEKEIWTNLGTKIAEGINAFVANTKWDKVGFTLSATAVGIVIALATAIKKTSTTEIKQAFIDLIDGIEWEATGWALGDLVATIATKLYELVSDSETWSELGNKIGSGIKSFFDGMNSGNGWAKIGGTIGNSIKGIVTSLTTALNSLTAKDYEDIGKGIADLFTSAIQALKETDWKDFLDACKTAIKNILKGMDIDASDIVLTLVGIGVIVSSIAGLKLASTITSAVLSSMLQTAVSGLMSNPGTATAAFEIFKTGAGMMLTVGKITLGVGAALVVGYKVGTSLGQFIAKQLASAGIISEDASGEYIANSELSLTQKISEIKLAYQDTDENGDSYLKKGWNAMWDDWMKPVFDEGKSIAIKITSLTANLVEGWNNLSDKTWDPVFELGKEIWNGIKSGFTKAVDWLSPITDMFDKAVAKIKEIFGISSPAKKMEEYGENIFLGIVEGFKAKFDKIKDAIAELPGKIKAWFTEHFPNGFDALEGVSNVISIGVSLVKDGWETVSGWVGDATQKGTEAVDKAIGLAKDGWTTVTGWVDDAKQKGTSLVQKGIDLIKGKAPGLSGVWDTVSSWVNTEKGNTAVDQSVGLTQGKADGVSGTWKTVSDWVKTKLGTISAPVTLTNKKDGKSLWKTVADWIKNVKSKGKMNVNATVTLKAKNNWKSVQSWVGSGGEVSTYVNLIKNGWESVAGWAVGCPNFARSQITADQSWLNVWVNLKKGTTSESLKGASLGGKITGGSLTGFGWFANGGSVRNGKVASWWNRIPKYAGGTNKAHGTLFVAGEAGPEIMGHVNGSTEILNRSQLASTMYTSIVAGMQAVLAKLGTVNINFDFTPLLNGLTSIPIPVVVTGQVLPANAEFMKSREEERLDIREIKDLMYNILDKLDDSSSNHPPIMLKLDSRTVAEAVWDETEKRYKQTGRRYSFG